MTISSRTAVLALLLAGGFAPQAVASGFQLREQSPSAQGNAFAGVSAGGSDISSMFFNPATLTQFASSEILTGVSVVSPNTNLTNGQASPAAGSYPAAPSSTGNACSPSPLPNLYAMWSLSPKLKLGFSINAPFGMATEYGSDSIVRYHALKSDLKVLDFGPSVAYRINPQWSVGAAFVARHTQAELTNAVDFGLATGHPGMADGKVTLNGSDWSYGYKLGVTWQPNEDLRMGLGYQSSVKVNIKGDASFEIPASLSGMSSILAAQGFQDNRIAAEVDLPSTLSLGFDYKLEKGVSFQVEVAYTDWSRFKELKIELLDNQADGLPLTNSTTEEKWNDTWFVAMGLTWKASDAWTFRLGGALDQGATNDTYRTPRIPDADRKWVSGGLGYAFSKHLGMDLAFTHIFVDSGNLALTTAGVGNATRGNLSGTFHSSIDIFSASMRYTF
ncbi:MAG: fadL [Holophagaceae bacterium]|nr:fadL [Holophagaceae bacterium]